MSLRLVALLGTCAACAATEPPAFANLTEGSEVNSVAWSPDASKVVAGSADGLVRVWELYPQKALDCKGHAPFGVNSAEFSPDGSLLASGSNDNTVRVWSASDCRSLQTLEGHTDSVNAVSFSPSGEYLVSASEDQTIRVWDTSSWQLVVALGGHTAKVSSAAFSPDGKHLATSSWDKTIRVWDTASWQTVKTLQDDVSKWVSSVSYSPDGRYLASGHSSLDDENAITIWDTSTWESRTLQVPTLQVPTRRSEWPERPQAAPEPRIKNILSVSYSFDGMFLAAGGGSVHDDSDNSAILVWDLRSDLTSWKVVKLEGHDRHVSSVRFQPGGSQIAAGSWDRTVLIWNFLPPPPEVEPAIVV